VVNKSVEFAAESCWSMFDIRDHMDKKSCEIGVDNHMGHKQ
ncbi:hypothetical protein A2U01_0086035, partial [Trifolium medium]|nr:hypothetical protein [Trifolium medium]